MLVYGRGRWAVSQTPKLLRIFHAKPYRSLALERPLTQLIKAHYPECMITDRHIRAKERRSS